MVGLSPQPNDRGHRLIVKPSHHEAAGWWLGMEIVCAMLSVLMVAHLPLEGWMQALYLIN